MTCSRTWKQCERAPYGNLFLKMPGRHCKHHCQCKGSLFNLYMKNFHSTSFPTPPEICTHASGARLSAREHPWAGEISGGDRSPGTHTSEISGDTHFKLHRIPGRISGEISGDTHLKLHRIPWILSTSEYPESIQPVDLQR